MAWQITEKKISDFEELERRPRAQYRDLYNKIFNLKVGEGLEVETESAKQGDNVRNAINGMLKNKGLREKYFACNRLNKVYIGRVK